MSARVLIIAGEISGDMHAAKMVRDIKARDPDVSFYGVGGDLLEAEGMEVQYHVRDMAVMGLSEVLKRYGFFRRVFAELIEGVDEDPPDAVLLVDYPGFNLRFARKMQERGIRVIYYICPQVWAWKQGRIKKMERYIDRLLVIFPFEVDLFKGRSIAVDYVGHPLADEVAAFEASGKAAELEWDAPEGKEQQRLAVLPGSRRQEIERILPALLKTCEALKAKHENLSVIVAAASVEIKALIEAQLAEQGIAQEGVRIEVDQTRSILLRADAALVTSGTATLEAALCGCPMVIVYKTAALTYAVGKRVVKVDHIGMVNIVAGKEVCPEFIQAAVLPESLVSAISPLLQNTQKREKMLAELETVRKLLNVHQAADAAELIVTDLRNRAK